MRIASATGRQGARSFYRLRWRTRNDRTAFGPAERGVLARKATKGVLVAHNRDALLRTGLIRKGVTMKKSGIKRVTLSMVQPLFVERYDSF